MHQKVVSCWLIVSLLACQPTQTPRQLTPAFYHWQTTFNPTASETARLRQLGIQKLYLRFFDVDWNAATRRAVPKAALQFSQPPRGLAIVPVVFITNRTVLNIPMALVPELARLMTDKIRRLAIQGQVSYREVQIDCDWSPGSRDRYFALLRALRGQLGVPLSATIRLHQVKYAARTGVPPVDRGMLMCYNVADWKSPDTRNSILDLDVVDRYTGFLDHYPLPLDAVLPLFHWTVVYRNGRFFKILNNLDRTSLAKCAALRMQSDTNRFVAQRDTVAFGFPTRPGDLFRVEACSPGDLIETQHRLLARIHNRNLTFALYHLDSATIARYSHETLQTLFRPVP